tara:strand:- start:39787 stop:43566 length:3780 start_codon:yes stop_codon:yes gene_type:complete
VSDNDNKWEQPAAPPPPLFTGKKEKDLVKQVTDEVIERVIGTSILYYPISLAHSDYHPLYGEAIKKTYLPPVHVEVLAEWEGEETTTTGFGIDKKSSVTIHFHKRRLTEDQNLFVREGDFIQYGEQKYEIITLGQPKQLFGQPDSKIEISAKCIRARDGTFPSEAYPNPEEDDPRFTAPPACDPVHEIRVLTGDTTSTGGAGEQPCEQVYERPGTPPPPLFTGKKESNLVKQVGDELLERVIGQQIVYFPISLGNSDYHELYGESINKTFLPPIRVFAAVDWKGSDTTTTNFGIDRKSEIEVKFHKRRLTEDQNLFVREGDFVLYGKILYEIVTVGQPRLLFGKIDEKYEVVASCIRAREGTFRLSEVQGTVSEFDLDSVTACENANLVIPDGVDNTMSNVGAGAGVFKNKTGINFNMKTLVEGDNITLTSTADEITINSVGAGGDWDGQRDGDAAITGSLVVTDSTFFGDALSDTHTFTGSILQTGSGGTSIFNDEVRVAGNFSASYLSGDGSGLTGVTGDWDGQHIGNAAITGSLEVLNSTTFGALSTDVHKFTGSLQIGSASAQHASNLSHGGVPAFEVRNNGQLRTKNDGAKGFEFVSENTPNGGGGNVATFYMGDTDPENPKEVMRLDRAGGFYGKEALHLTSQGSGDNRDVRIAGAFDEAGGHAGISPYYDATDDGLTGSMLGRAHKRWKEVHARTASFEEARKVVPTTSINHHGYEPYLANHNYLTNFTAWGNPSVYDPLTNNILARGDIKFDISRTVYDSAGVEIASDASGNIAYPAGPLSNTGLGLPFDGVYQQLCWNPLTASTVIKTNIDFTTNEYYGPATSSIVYSLGKVVVHYASNATGSSVSGRIRRYDKNLSSSFWHPLDNLQDISTDPRYTIHMLDIPNYNYMEELEISITASENGYNLGGAPSYMAISEIECFLDNLIPYNHNLPKIDGYSDNAMYGDLDMRGGNDQKNIVLDASTGDITMSGTLSTHGVTMRGHILPDEDDVYDIGSPSKQIRDIYVSTGSIIFGGTHAISIDPESNGFSFGVVDGVDVPAAGFTIPQLTNEELSSLQPKNGTMVYDTTQEKFLFCQGGEWLSLGSQSGGGEQPTIPRGSGILSLTDDGDGPNRQLLEEYAENSVSYSGKSLYLANVSGIPLEAFSQGAKFYFNEGGVWHPSHFFSNDKVEYQGDPIYPDMQDILSLNGASAADRAILTGLDQNASSYGGRAIYLGATGSAPIGVFSQENKYYFNEGGVWHASSFYTLKDED